MFGCCTPGASFEVGGSGGGGGAPTGPAGGQLGGTYPNPIVVGFTETGGPTALTIGVIGNQSLLARVGTAIVSAMLSAGLAFAGGQLSVTAVSNAAQGVLPAITAANAVPLSNGGGTAAVWTALSGGGSPVGSTRAINTTAPLAGGGDLSADRTLSVATVSNTSSGVAPAITAANAVPLSNGGGTAAVWTALSGGGSPVGSTRAINTTAPLAGGGDLSADRTLTVATVSNTSSGVAPAITAANAVPLSNGGGTAAVWTALSGGGSPVGSSRTISTTAPLAGGGDLSANRTLTVATVSNTTSGVVVLVPGTVGLALIASATAAAWGTDFGANDLTTTAAYISNGSSSTTSYLRLGLAPGSGANSASATGSIRLRNGLARIAQRNAGDTADQIAFTVDTATGGSWLVGDAGGAYGTGRLVCTGQMDLSTNGTIVLGSSGATGVKIFGPTLNFDNTTVAPTFQQLPDVTATVTGDLFTSNAQDVSGNTATTGGARLDRAGDATGAGGTHTGGAYTSRAGDATGGSGTRTGGAWLARSGTGASGDGEITLQRGTANVFATTSTTVVVGQTSSFSNISLGTTTGLLRTNTNTRISWTSTVFSLAGVSIFNFGSGVDSQMQVDGSSMVGFDRGTGTVRNMSLFADGSQNFQTGDRILFVGDRVAAPTGNPAAGGFMSSAAGAGTWRGSGGTVTTFGAA